MDDAALEGEWESEEQRVERGRVEALAEQGTRCLEHDGWGRLAFARSLPSVRVVTWNCQGDGIGKLSHLAPLRPDIAVIPEQGSHPTRPPAPSPLLTAGPNSFISFGVDGARGISVASWGAWELTRADVPPIAGQVIGAVNVTGPDDVALLAVWACLSGGVKINPVIEAIDTWGEWLAGKAVIAAGDFNSGHFWDDKRTVNGGDHRPLVAALERIGLRTRPHVTRSQHMTERLTLFDPDSLLDKYQVARLNAGIRCVERLTTGDSSPTMPRSESSRSSTRARPVSSRGAQIAARSVGLGTLVGVGIAVSTGSSLA